MQKVQYSHVSCVVPHYNLRCENWCFQPCSTLSVTQNFLYTDMEWIGSLELLLHVLAAWQATASGQSLEKTLDSFDQQLAALSSHLAALSDRLDCLLQERQNTDYSARWLARTLDDQEGWSPLSLTLVANKIAKERKQHLPHKPVWKHAWKQMPPKCKATDSLLMEP